MRRALVVWSIAVLLSACEDGPEQIFTPSDGDGAKESGYEPSAPWFQDGEKTFDFNAGQGDSVDRARFCDEREMTETINTMVSQPIVPDVGLGGLNMWSSDGTLTHANELIGRPEDGKFCDPEVYSNALTWGPTYEIIAFINEETKLMEALQIGQGYLGKLEGHYTAQNGTQVAVSLEMRNRVRIGGVELDTYASSANQASSPNSWVNHARINEMYRMLRETFFSDRTTDDCFATQVCEVFYASPNESNPQQTDVYFADSGVYLVFSPEGHLSYVVLEPVRLAKFETSVTLQLLDAAGKVAPKLTSASKPGCNIDLTGKAWQDFQTACVSADDTRTLTRATYDVHSARDAVDVNFNGVTLSYLRRTSKTTLLKDGERPGNTDKLFGMSFYRDLNAPVAEFVPANLGALYKARIEARLKALVGESSGHPFASYVVDLGSADLSSSPAPIGAITWTLDGNEYNLVDVVAAGVLGAYGALTPEQKRAAEGVLHPVFLIEPFVDSVLSAFTQGKSDAPQSFKGFLVTDDRRWSVGYVNYIQDGVPVRLVVQYSLSYGAITAVTVEKGKSQIDEQYDSLLDALNSSAPYYGIEFSLLTDENGAPVSPLGLGGTGIEVKGADRQLKMVDIDLRVASVAMEMLVPGSVIGDQAGFKKQVRGERYEFVPAHEVRLLGKETMMVFWLTESRIAAGTGGCAQDEGCIVQSISAIHQPDFKVPMELCEGLEIGFGDDLRAQIDAYARGYGEGALRACEIVFNYSANGNVLDSVTSLAHKINFSTMDGRATAVTLWQ